MIRRLLIALPILLAAWIAILALVLRLGVGAPGVFVLFPSAGLLASLEGEVAVTGASSVSLTLRGAQPDLVRRIYAAGAWLVLPAGLEACIPPFLRDDAPPDRGS